MSDDDDDGTYYKFEIAWDGDPAEPPTRAQLAQALRHCANNIMESNDDSGPAMFGGWWNALQ